MKETECQASQVEDDCRQVSPNMQGNRFALIWDM